MMEYINITNFTVGYFLINMIIFEICRPLVETNPNYNQKRRFLILTLIGFTGSLLLIIILISRILRRIFR